MNSDDRARQVAAYNEHKGPSAAKRGAGIAGMLDVREVGARRRWILCDTLTGYPVAQLSARLVGAPWEKQTMAVELGRSPATAAVAFLEAAGLYLALCCEDGGCTECVRLADAQADDADRSQPIDPTRMPWQQPEGSERADADRRERGQS